MKTLDFRKMFLSSYILGSFLQFCVCQYMLSQMSGMCIMPMLFVASFR